MVALTFGNTPITLHVGENTGAARRAAAAAAVALTEIEAVRDEVDGMVEGITLPGLVATTPSLTFLTELSDTQDLIIADGATGFRTNLRVLKKWLGLLPPLVPAGSRFIGYGDSRDDNGFSAEPGNGLGRTTGVPEAIRLQGIFGWMLQALGWPMEVTGQWTFGGSKSSESCHDHALAVGAARNPHAVFYLGTTNDPVDYTGSGGSPSLLGPIELGDPDADPATLPRVGDRVPSGTGLAAQGTTLGNLDKFIRFWGDGTANGLGRSVPVIMFEIPTENAGRRAVNRAVHLWLQKHKALATYANLIAPDVYTPLLEDPAMIDGPVNDEVVRTDIEATVGPLRADGDDTGFLHPSPACARFIGETMADDADVIAAMGGMASRLLLPDGTNDASFINTNPSVAVGNGSGVLGYSGSSSPAPTGTVAQGWELGHSVATGTIGVAASFDGGDQVITITRTGGSTPATARNVELRGTAINITPVAGDYYVLDGEIEVPGRDPQDLFTVFPHVYFNETGLVDDYGQNIAAGSYGAFGAQNPNYFPKDGDNLIAHGVPFEITPAMVASATGTISISARCTIVFSDAMDTATNGALVIKIKSLGIRKLTLAEAHVTAPAVPTAGPYYTAAPVISGSQFVGGTITLTNGTLSAGTITDARLLRDGIEVSYTGDTYELTSGDLSKTFVLENTGTSGGTVVGLSQAFGPIETAPAELATLISALAGGENNAIFDFTTAAVISTVYTVADYSGNGNPALQSSATRQPVTSGTLGAVMDGSNDCAGLTWQTAAPSTATVIMTVKKDVGADSKRLLSDGTSSTSNIALFYSNGSTTVTNGTVTVDGASVTNRDQLYDALNDGAEHTVMVTGLNVSAWPALFFSRITAAHQGSIRRGVVIDEATASLSAARAAAVAWAEAT